MAIFEILGELLIYALLGYMAFKDYNSKGETKGVIKIAGEIIQSKATDDISIAMKMVAEMGMLWQSVVTALGAPPKPESPDPAVAEFVGTTQSDLLSEVTFLRGDIRDFTKFMGKKMDDICLIVEANTSRIDTIETHLDKKEEVTNND